MKALKSFACVIAVLLACSLSAAADNNEHPSQRLEGSWAITAAQETPFPLPFRMLATFVPGGGLVGTDDVALSGLIAPDSPYSVLQSAGHGAWRRIGHRRFAFNYLKLNYDGRGRPTGVVRIVGTARLAPSLTTLTATFTFEILDLNNAPLLTGAGQLRGERIPASIEH